MEQYRFGMHRLSLCVDDITKQEVDCIVNAANSRLAGGGGVDGAIHRAAGPQLRRELAEIRARQGGCPTGKVVVTSGGELAARWIIHTVGPIYQGNREDEALLASCYHEACRAAVQLKAQTVAFPSISTGAYGYPTEEAAPIALRAVIKELENGGPEEVRFVLFSQPDYECYLRHLRTLLRSSATASGKA